MGVERVRAYFQTFGMEDQVMELEQSSATVELAAEALGVIPARIAKTLSFKGDACCILIVTAGDRKIDNAKFKSFFGIKAKMLKPDEVMEEVGYAVGGVCPFGVPDSAVVYLDESLQRFETVFPAFGSGNSAIELSCAALFQYAKAVEWIDVCKEI